MIPFICNPRECKMIYDEKKTRIEVASRGAGAKFASLGPDLTSHSKQG